MGSDQWNALFAGLAIGVYSQLTLFGFWLLFSTRAKAKAEREKAAAARAEVTRLHAMSAIESLGRRVGALERRLDSHEDRHNSRRAG